MSPSHQSATWLISTCGARDVSDKSTSKERGTNREHVVGSNGRERLVEMSLELLDDVEEGLVGDDADRDGGGSPGGDEGLLRWSSDVDFVDAESGLTPPEEGCVRVATNDAEASRTDLVMSERRGSVMCEF